MRDRWMVYMLVVWCMYIIYINVRITKTNMWIGEYWKTHFEACKLRMIELNIMHV